MFRMKIMSLAALCTAVNAGAETINELNLVCDTNITVAAGATTDVARVSGGAYTITKSGPGVIRFGFIKNTAAKLVVAGGGFGFYRPPVPAAASSAFLHVDANVLDPEYVTTVNGTNFVDRWTDASGGPHYAYHLSTAVGTWRTGANKPYTTKNFQNGLDVMDFGYFQDAKVVDSSGNPLGYGAAMGFDDWCRGVRDVYAVTSYREEMLTVKTEFGSTSPTPLIGAAEAWAFQPFELRTDGNYPTLINYWQAPTWQVQLGEVYYNDTYKQGTATGNSLNSAGAQFVPAGMFYLNVRPTDYETAGHTAEKALCNSFARDRSISFGGQRIGEFLVFTTRLSDTDHDAMENYLRAKWFPQAFASVTVSSASRIENSGGGDMLIRSVPDGSDISVTKGSIEINALKNVGAWIHLDASRLDGSTVSEENGRSVVTKWADADGGSHYASHDTTVQTWRADPENRKPFLTAGLANGLNVIDFGYPQDAGITNGTTGAGTGYGAAMKFDSTCSTIRETIVVAADRPELPEVKSAYPKSGNASPYIGGARTGSVNFYRHALESGRFPVILNPWQAITKPIWGYENGMTVDGVACGTGKSVRVDDNLHIVNFRMTADGGATGLASDHGGSYGGVRIGEVMVFESELDDDTRTHITNSLAAKWTGGTLRISCGSVEVAEGASLSVPWVDVSAESLAIGGTVTARSIAPAALSVVSASAAVEGALDLSAPGTINVSAAAFPSAAAGDTVRIVAAGEMRGAPKAWTASGDFAALYSVRFSAGADGLYMSLRDPGLLMIFR